jgi:hypothetical protein
MDHDHEGPITKDMIRGGILVALTNVVELHNMLLRVRGEAQVTKDAGYPFADDVTEQEKEVLFKLIDIAIDIGDLVLENDDITERMVDITQQILIFQLNLN